MANNSILLWSPDTCGCTLHLAYDSNLPPDQRTFTPVTEDEAEAIVQRRRDAGEKNINPSRQPPAVLCPVHAPLGHTPARHKQVMQENQAKNRAFGHAQALMPDLKPEEYVWSFDDKRNLQATIARMNPGQKAQVQKALDAEFGPGSVQVG